MSRISRNRKNTYHYIVDALRRNNRLPHALLLGITAAVLLGAVSWLALSLGTDALEYLDQHGWEKALEQLDKFTKSVWDRTEN
jgi:hypothetical protein